MMRQGFQCEKMLGCSCKQWNVCLKPLLAAWHALSIDQAGAQKLQQAWMCCAVRIRCQREDRQPVMNVCVEASEVMLAGCGAPSSNANQASVTHCMQQVPSQQGGGGEVAGMQPSSGDGGGSRGNIRNISSASGPRSTFLERRQS